MCGGVAPVGGLGDGGWSRHAGHGGVGRDRAIQVKGEGGLAAAAVQVGLAFCEVVLHALDVVGAGVLVAVEAEGPLLGVCLILKATLASCGHGWDACSCDSAIVCQGWDGTEARCDGMRPTRRSERAVAFVPQGTNRIRRWMQPSQGCSRVDRHSPRKSGSGSSCHCPVFEAWLLSVLFTPLPLRRPAVSQCCCASTRRDACGLTVEWTRAFRTMVRCRQNFKVTRRPPGP